MVIILCFQLWDLKRLQQSILGMPELINRDGNFFVARVVQYISHHCNVLGISQIITSLKYR